MIPSDCGGDRARLGEVRVEDARPDDALVGVVSSRSRTRPNRRSWASGLLPVEPARDLGQRRAGRDKRRRDGERPRAWHSGGRRSPCPSRCRPSGPPPAPRRPRRAARRGGSPGVRPSRTSLRPPDRPSRPGRPPEFDTWWSMMTRGSSSKSARVAIPDVADPIERPAVGDHEQVVRLPGLRVRPEPFHAGQEVVQRPEAGPCTPASPARRAPRRASPRRASLPACPHRGFHG